jgi:hypothetical protein
MRSREFTGGVGTAREKWGGRERSGECMGGVLNAQGN